MEAALKISMLLVGILFSVANAQTDALKENFQFFPLRTGDYREYKSWGVHDSIFHDSSAYSVEVYGDTLLRNGLSYRILRHDSFYPDTGTYDVFERLDSSSGCLYMCTGDTSFTNQELKMDSLFACPGDTIESAWEDRLAGPYERIVCDSITEDTILGTASRTRYMHNIGSLLYMSYRLSQGFGLTYRQESFDFGNTAVYLVYGRINGVEYGTRIIDGVKSRATARASFTLSQNYPNPFNPVTNIRYRIVDGGSVTLKVYDVLGREAKTLVNEVKKPGSYEVRFDGSGLASGVYFYKLSIRSLKRTGIIYTETKKLLLLK